MKSVFWPVPDAIAGRAGPIQQPWSAAELRAAGFDVVRNLSDHAPDTDALSAAGLESAWVPLPGDIPPSAATEAQCLEALPRAFAILASEQTKSRRVLIHCYAGKDRTGMLMALFIAKREGVAVAEAIRSVREIRPPAIIAPGWEEMALRVLPQVLASLAHARS